LLVAVERCNTLERWSWLTAREDADAARSSLRVHGSVSVFTTFAMQS
jgi:hypothetical protein